MWFARLVLSKMYQIDVMTPRHWNSSVNWKRDKFFKKCFFAEKSIIILPLIFTLGYSNIMAIKR